MSALRLMSTALLAIVTMGFAPPANAPRTIIYAANYDDNSVTEYGAFANGDVRPIRTIAGPHTLMDRPTAIAVDASGLLYVEDFSYTHPHLSVFAPGADGDATPIRTITAKSFGGVHAFGICVDALGYLYVSDTYLQSIRVFAPGANGDVAPVRTVQDPNLSEPWGVAVDRSEHLWVTDAGNTAILEFPPGANGVMRASRKIEGPATGLRYPVSVDIGPDGTIYVSDVHAARVFAYAATARGDVSPLRAFAPPGSYLPSYGVVYRGGELYVLLQSGSNQYAVGAFSPDANGITEPLREILGPQTQLDARAIGVR